MLTFAGNSMEPLLAGQLDVVFRKMGPSMFTPSLVYAYVSAPSSAVVAKFSVISWERQPLKQALQQSVRGMLSEAYLRQYAQGYNELLVIRPGPIQVARTPVTLKLLSTEYEFWPSSTFMPLSGKGVATLDRLADFKRPTTRKSKE